MWSEVMRSRVGLLPKGAGMIHPEVVGVSI